MTPPNDTYPDIFPIVAKAMIGYLRDRGAVGRIVTRAMNACLTQLNTSLPYKLGAGVVPPVTFVSPSTHNVVHLRLLSGGNNEMCLSVAQAKEPELFALLCSLQETAMLRDGKPSAGCVGVCGATSADAAARRNSENLLSLFDVLTVLNTPRDLP